jgi:hypothetical protein
MIWHHKHRYFCSQTMTYCQRDIIVQLVASEYLGNSGADEKSSSFVVAV